jgi:hypothetical protein
MFETRPTHIRNTAAVRAVETEVELALVIRAVCRLVKQACEFNEGTTHSTLVSLLREVAPKREKQKCIAVHDRLVKSPNRH